MQQHPAAAALQMQPQLILSNWIRCQLKQLCAPSVYAVAAAVLSMQSHWLRAV
jgi:hypothetical protein